MDWKDDDTTHPWEQGGDLPWETTDEAAGWSPPDPEAWRAEADAELPNWPEFVSGADTWRQELDDDE
jgi:hypothetical protein